MRYQFRQLDLSICAGLLSALFAFCQFALEGGYWVEGVLYAVIALMCFTSYSEIRAYQNEIVDLRQKIEELESQIKHNEPDFDFSR